MTIAAANGWATRYSADFGHLAPPPPPAGPTSKDQCLNGGWRTFTNPPFKNQGDCISYVVHLNPRV